MTELEHAGRFVQDQHRGGLGSVLTNQGALALAAGELVEGMMAGSSTSVAAVGD